MKTHHPPSKWFYALALAATLATYALVVIGGIARVTHAGASCANDPLCQGQLIPRLDGAMLIAFSHRAASALVTLLVLTMALVAWRKYRGEKWITTPATFAVLLLLLESAIGGTLGAQSDWAAVASALHLGAALLVFASLLTIALFARRPWDALPRATPDALPRLALWSLIGTLALTISGTLVTATNAASACADWPLCNGNVIPTGGMLEWVAVLHRYISVIVGVLVLVTFARAWRRGNALLTGAAIIAAIMFGIEVLVGAGFVQAALAASVSVLHLASAAAVWASMIIFTVFAHQTTRQMAAPPAPHKIARANRFASLANYLALMKPVVIALLLTTTLGGMLVAARGMPTLSLVFFALLGGALTAGGASAINSYIDRDIDPQMGRTARRPIPAGKISARRALVFGLVTSALGVLVYAVFINGLSALLSFIGLFYYVVIYTLILKRRTPQSVVIGGAAGAIPPLVGWAAVTNEINLLAAFLFLIIFSWTPPHTWALMLMVAQDYEKVNVPMAPVAFGEAETRRQIALYTLWLVAITLLPFAWSNLGAFYLLAAMALGARFLHLAYQLWRDGSKPVARKLYVYSNLYLAFLFAAMVFDQVGG